jgi:hypothetical protein
MFGLHSFIFFALLMCGTELKILTGSIETLEVNQSRITFLLFVKFKLICGTELKILTGSIETLEVNQSRIIFLLFVKIC